MMRWAVAALVCAACGKDAPPATSPPASTQAPSPQAQLRDDVRRRVAASHPEAKFEPKDDLTLGVKLADGTEAEIRLDNLWHEIEGATPEEREAMIAQFVKVMAGGPPALDADPETKLKSIVPLVRNEAYLEEMRKMGPPATRPLAADLHVVYAYDGEDTLTVIPLAELEPLKLGAEELDRRAVENLNAAIGSEIELHTVGPMFMVTCGGTYESSLLVVDNLWKKLAEKVKGSIVAACPARDLLLFTDGSDPAGMAALKKAVDEAYAEGGRTISKRLLRRTAEGWKPLEE